MDLSGQGLSFDSSNSFNVFGQGDDDLKLPDVVSGPHGSIEQLLSALEVDESGQFNPQMLTEEQSNCQICYGYALNAVTCANLKCSKQFCHKCMTKIKSRINSKCPFCCGEPFLTKTSPYAHFINQIKVTCKLCQLSYPISQEQDHYKNDCLEFKKVPCPYCPHMLDQSLIIRHFKEKHLDKLEEVIESFYLEKPLLDHKAVIKREGPKLEVLNKRVVLGKTGKFYCGDKREKCGKIPESYCGPFDGLNCLQCMTLDAKRFGLRKGFLLNSSGQVCWREEGVIVCGLVGNAGECRPGQSCLPCREIHQIIQLYRSLM